MMAAKWNTNSSKTLGGLRRLANEAKKLKFLDDGKI